MFIFLSTLLRGARDGGLAAKPHRTVESFSSSAGEKKKPGDDDDLLRFGMVGVGGGWKRCASRIKLFFVLLRLGRFLRVPN